METYHSEEKESQAKFYQTIGDEITLRRKKVGISQEDLAWMLSISRVSIVNIEAGKQRSPLHFIISLCTVLKIELSEIIPQYTGNVKSLQDLYAFKSKAAFNKVCNHEEMEHIISTTGKEYYICHRCNYSQLISI